MIELSTDQLLIRFDRAPQAESLKAAIRFLAEVAETLVAKEAGYGAIDRRGGVFAPDCTPEQRIRTRIDEKLDRIRNKGLATPDEDTHKDLVGYLALLRGVLTNAPDAVVEQLPAPLLHPAPTPGAYGSPTPLITVSGAGVQRYVNIVHNGLAAGVGPFDVADAHDTADILRELFNGVAGAK